MPQTLKTRGESPPDRAHVFGHYDGSALSVLRVAGRTQQPCPVALPQVCYVGGTWNTRLFIRTPQRWCNQTSGEWAPAATSAGTRAKHPPSPGLNFLIYKILSSAWKRATLEPNLVHHKCLTAMRKDQDHAVSSSQSQIC